MRTSWFLGAAGLVATAALAQNGRPPPPSSTPAPIKIGKPSSSGSGNTRAPIKIGKPAGSEGQGIGTEKQIYDATWKQPLQPATTSWKVGEPLKLLDPVATHVCLLTGISGNFAGGGERVVVGIDKNASGGARWYISGSSGQAELRATATCVAKAKFVPAVLNTSRLASYKLDHHMNGACADHIAASGWGYDKYAHFISEVAGKWRGGGEQLAVVRTGQNLGAIRVNGCSGFVDGAVTALGNFAPGAIARYWTANGNTGTPENATFARLSQNAKSSWLPGGEPFIAMDNGTPLAPVDQAICGIVYLSGKMQGYGESVDIEQKPVLGKMYWKVRLSNLADGGYLSTAVRCFARDQR